MAATSHSGERAISGEGASTSDAACDSARYESGNAASAIAYRRRPLGSDTSATRVTPASTPNTASASPRGVGYDRGPASRNRQTEVEAANSRAPGTPSSIAPSHADGDAR